MNDIRVIIAIVLGMLFIERLLVVNLTKREGSKAFFRKVVILHPNAISIMRLPMGILSAWFASMGHWTLATLWFAFWMITDLSDGTIARNCDLGSETGKWLDPLSDKFMYFPVLLFFVYSETVSPALHPLPVICFIVIDIVGQASRLFVKKKAANQFGKAIFNYQKAVEIEDGDTPEVLQRRIMEQAEWILLPKAVEKISKEIVEKRSF